ncbi:head maturation protease, ClpP-related [Olsenella sp. HMSC062G07]|uniref:head maturation protease, ClpP-related n=1 Tax=Olsenella sp. HMSC062G07 TaxID=1739330 RepID=UPI0008A64631|nr:head maturation protease, ClpP-related [Olsenella sp. HMSC062G07]OFK22929.1 hypothetical protein HMPREF2826_00710 [Olsenella sp. HMSC062G07]
MFKVKNEAERATVYLYGTVGTDWWDEESSNTAKEFAQTLDGLSPKPLDIRIDSCGGDVYEGFAIASAIQRYEGQTTAYVDGIAASAASYIALMADKVVMCSFAQLMIHDAWTYAQGNAAELMETAARLEELDNTIAGIIAARSGKDLDDVKALMDAETWFDAEAAVDTGMADEVAATEQRVAASLDRAILSHYRHVPDGMEGKSHARQRMPEDEGRTFVLGNRVYKTKE